MTVRSSRLLPAAANAVTAGKELDDGRAPAHVLILPPRPDANFGVWATQSGDSGARFQYLNW
ncbi:MAG: hypothetical protein M3065_07330 [Actinomycetota bacterium]|nr:hypothetical protein [Actinomycetota bacterium]